MVCHAEGIPIRLKAGVFDPTYDGPRLKSSLGASPSIASLCAAKNDTHYYIVQCKGPVLKEWREDIAGTGSEILNYIPDYAYLIRVGNESVLSSLSKLSCVRWIGPYLPVYKVDDDLLEKDGNTDVSIILHPGEEDSSARAALKGTISDVENTGSRKIIHARVGIESLAQMAQMDEVSEIRVHRNVHILNNVSRGIMDVTPAWTDLGLYGANQTIGVCDTGLDTGNYSTLLSDFQGRVIAAFALARTGDWSDLEGHGTHVAGSIMGNGSMSGGSPASHSYVSSFAGAAPEANLVFQSAADSFGNLTGITDDLNSLFLQAYSAGARIHSNSWGTSSQSIYETLAQSTDQFCWDHKDMLILYAAGNDGADNNHDGVVDLKSLDAPSTAKNSVCVGASEALRPTGGYGNQNYSIFDFTAPPISTDPLADNPNGMAAWSSRGPTSDGRIKPDVVAPGTNIISCRSQLVTAALNTWCYGAYNSYYVYLGGTSMATPLVAGSCALIRQYFTDKRGVKSPSSALVKAALINGAVDLYPGQYGTGSHLEIPRKPNPVEGWGRVDVANSIGKSSGRSVAFVDNKTGLSTNGSISYQYTVASGMPLRVTLVWTDYAATPLATVDLVNDLDLTVTAPDGSVLHGNGGDHVNNVEGVEVAAPIAGTYTVNVSGYNVPQGPQPFALIVSGEMGSIQGTVANAAGLPVPGVTVTASPVGGSTTYTRTTDSSGAYSMSVPDGSYSVSASLSNVSFSPASASVTVLSQPVSGVNFTLSGALAVSITTPTTEHSYETSSPMLSISGQYAGGATSITWQNNRSGSGVCSMPSYNQWNSAGILLQPGVNIITVTASDGTTSTKSAYLKAFYSTATGQVRAVGIASDSSVWYTSTLSAWNSIPGHLKSTTIGDFNADGVRDVAGIATDGTVWTSTDKTSWTKVPGVMSSIVSGNFDGSGHDGLAGVAPDGHIWYTTNLQSWTRIQGSLSSIAAGDFAGNGIDGLVGLAANGSVWYTTDLSNWTNIPGSLSQIAVGDLNGDGTDDIAGVAADGGVWYTTDLRNWTRVPGYLSTIAVGDLDGSGSAEIVGMSADHRVWVSTDLQSWTMVPGILSTLLAGDLNGDGKGEIVGIASDSGAWYMTDLTSWHSIPGKLASLYVNRR